MLGLNIHLEESIAQGFLDKSQLWVAEYLEARPTEIEDDGARVTAFLRVSQRTETINQQFIDDNMTRYQLDSRGRATHLIDQVVFGGEFIFAMRRAIDLKSETKKSAESRILLEAKKYFDQIINSNWTDIKPPTELENVSCTLYSNIKTSQMMRELLKVCSIEQSVKWVRNAMKNDGKLRPVYIRLRFIPAQLEFRLQTEKIVTRKRKMELNLLRTSTKSCILSTHPCLQNVPPFRNSLAQFQELLEPLRSKLTEFHAFHTANSTDPKLVIEQQEEMIQLLSNAMNWLLRLRHQVETLHPILNDVHLALFDMDEIDARQLSNYEYRIKIFVFNVNYEEDQLMKCLYKFLGYPPRDVKQPVFSIVAAEKDRLAAIGVELAKFSQEALSCSTNCTYQIGLASSPSTFVDGSIITVAYPAKEKAVATQIPDMPPPLIPIFPNH